MGSTNRRTPFTSNTWSADGVAFALVDHQAVLEARAAAALDEHPQAGADLVLLDQELVDLLGRRFRHVDHASNYKPLTESTAPAAADALSTLVASRFASRLWQRDATLFAPPGAASADVRDVAGRLGLAGRRDGRARPTSPLSRRSPGRSPLRAA